MFSGRASVENCILNLFLSTLCKVLAFNKECYVELGWFCDSLAVGFALETD